MHVDMVSAYYSGKYSYVFCITDLHDDFPATRLYFSLQYAVTIFGYPHDVHSKFRECMGTMSIEIPKVKIHNEALIIMMHSSHLIDNTTSVKTSAKAAELKFGV